MSAKLFLGIIAFFYVLIIVITMIKTKRFFTVIFLTVLQGICTLFAINLIGNYINVHIPVNGWSIGISSIGGIPGVIMMLLCGGFMG
ncbi:MAG: pro-sigmaK processing inhibitor BofA family protein [Clostridia bacterium]|nr:pro-sigmaK processing inhibitor BofA family protein [Clostridia bacterium]